GQLVGAAIAALADENRLDDLRRTAIQIDDLESAVTVSSPQDVLWGHHDAVRPRVRQAPGRAGNAPRNAADIRTVHRIDHVDAGIRSIGYVQPSSSLIDPHDVDA